MKPDKYLELMKRCILNEIYGALAETRYEQRSRQDGSDWPQIAHSMIGRKRLDNIQLCVEEIIKCDIPGDLIETGVWRGGAAIFMRSLIEAYEMSGRQVWVADSFEGVPKPNSDVYPEDAGDQLHSFDELSVSLDEVISNFRKYDLLDDHVKFLPGLFKDTLPSAPIASLALMRLDGDLYESTMDALVNLYPKLSIGGFVIIDDYGAIPACRKAVESFRISRSIRDELVHIDWTGVYWRRTC